MTKKDLFPFGVSAVGKYVNVGGLAYKVIGVFTDPGGDNEERLKLYSNYHCSGTLWEYRQSGSN